METNPPLFNKNKFIDRSNQKLKDITGTIIKILSDEWSTFSPMIVKREYKKKEFITQCGETEKYLSFIEKGVVRFWTQGTEKEITIGFAFQNSFASAYESFLTQTESSYNVEALTTTTLWSISYSDLQEIYKTKPGFNQFGRLAAEEIFIRKAKREMSLLKDSSEQRYLNLLKENRHLIQNIPLKYLASYIGVTPQSLSRIRKKI